MWSKPDTFALLPVSANLNLSGIRFLKFLSLLNMVQFLSGPSCTLLLNSFRLAEDIRTLPDKPELTEMADRRERPD